LEDFYLKISGKGKDWLGLSQPLLRTQPEKSHQELLDYRRLEQSMARWKDPPLEANAPKPGQWPLIEWPQSCKS